MARDATGRIRGPRSDRARNRRRLLDAARAAFIEDGPKVSIEAVARRAGVGTTTFFRHFPTKSDLVDAMLDDLAEGVRAGALTDPWAAFTLIFEEGCVLVPEDLLLFDTLGRHSPRSAEAARQATAAIVEPHVRRALAAGALRPDVTAEDIAALMRMADQAGPARPTALRVLLRGLRVAA
ncbi:TetR/AcrR family transcriptional regulator [Streptomyces sp. ICN988]|uniref:TetR/AcrR family transcriptional regulator n=1 Tax=Streptomyces sp. ICN988 TaxID=2983765 RepID=UPI0021E3DE64|nr:TetR/AcrR family transcriptional regulator [Streptomyces sp. ICN988]MCV2457816.1 TetR/AcrR family transcriptional regulator [Streptomyces sp. ICN988]